MPSNGCIRVGEAPESWGFTPERFDPMSYMWRNDGEVVFSFIATAKRGQGYLSDLRKAVEADGLAVAVPTPFPAMQAILERWGFEPRLQPCPEMGGDVDVWRLLREPEQGGEDTDA